MKLEKTNAARLLESEGIPFELISYEVDESDLSAKHVAEGLGMDPYQIFKTLVLQGDRTGKFVCVIPGMAELDLKLAAKASGNKKCEMLPLKQLLPTTGYIRGACSPVGMKRELPTYVDEYCKQYEVIYVSAGKRGLQIKIAPDDLVMFTKSKVCKLIHT